MLLRPLERKTRKKRGKWILDEVGVRGDVCQEQG